MPLETGNYIAELVPTNPLGVDAVNLGDNHIRLVKLCVQQSFPGFVGTTATPKFVTLTEDELNALIDAALKAGAATIAGLWDYTTVPTINGVAILEGDEVAALDTAVLNELQQPANRDITISAQTLQTDQGNAIRYTGTGGHTLAIDTLAAGTVMTVKNAGTATLSLALGTANAVQWLDGLGGAAPTGTRTLARSSVCELHWLDALTVEIWGNGLS